MNRIRVSAYAFLAAMLMLAFHHMMMHDARALCSNDATAYKECN